MPQDAVPQVEWFEHNGKIMDAEAWSNTHASSIMVFLNGGGMPETDWYGNRMVDNDFILIFNAHYEPIMFTLPSEQYGRKWRLIVDTHNPRGRAQLRGGIRHHGPVKIVPHAHERP